MMENKIIDKRLLFINLFSLIFGSIIIWNATIELNDEMKNQTCCYNNCDKNLTSEKDFKNPYDNYVFTAYFYVLAVLFFINSLIPWHVNLDINFYATYGLILFAILYTYSLLLLINLGSDYEECIPNKKPLALLIEHELFKFICIIMFYLILALIIVGFLLFYLCKIWYQTTFTKIKKIKMIKSIKIIV